MKRASLLVLLPLLPLLSSAAGPEEDAFESWVAELDDDLLLRGAQAPDVRVVRAVGSRGYDYARVSVITRGERLENEECFEYSKPFQGRWTHAYDLGTHNAACDPEKNSTFLETTVIQDADCLKLCNLHAPKCAVYTYFHRHKRCVLADRSCSLKRDDSATASYRNLGRQHLHSRLVKLRPGSNKIRVAGSTIDIQHVAEDAGTSGIIWADPCFSSRWIPCSFGKPWNTFTGSYEMINLISKDPSIHFFQQVGDMYYDQTGQLTKAMFDRFSLETKSKFHHAVLGNHDIAVAGFFVPGDLAHDQFGHGFMQFYAQDTLAAVRHRFGTNRLFNLTITPDDPNAKHLASGEPRFYNDQSNFFSFYKIGNIGIIGYSGVGDLERTLSDFKQACAYFADSPPPAGIFILGHWNNANTGVSSGMETPAIRSQVQKFKGCNIGDSLRYIDGHTHCNVVQERGESSPIGFMSGARGMIDNGKCLPMMGFTFVDSSRDNKLRVYHFHEHGAHAIDGKGHAAIKDCVTNTSSLHACTHLAELWLEADLTSPSDKVELATE